MRTQQGKIQVAHLLDTCYFYTHTNPLLRRKKKGNKRGERQDNLRKALIITEKLTFTLQLSGKNIEGNMRAF